MSLQTGNCNLIKAQILVNLNALVTAGVLGSVIEQEVTANILDLNITGFPCAVLGSSSQDAKWEYQQANKNTYTFPILIVQLVDNFISSNPGYMEDLRDAICLQFNNNFTLGGAAQLGIAAVTSPKVQTAEKGKKFVSFWLTLKCTTLANLTYSF